MFSESFESRRTHSIFPIDSSRSETDRTENRLERFTCQLWVVAISRKDRIFTHSFGKFTIHRAWIFFRIILSILLPLVIPSPTFLQPTATQTERPALKNRRVRRVLIKLHLAMSSAEMRTSSPSYSKVLWDKSIASNLPTVTYEEVMSSEFGVYEWVKRIVRLFSPSHNPLSLSLVIPKTHPSDFLPQNNRILMVSHSSPEFLPRPKLQRVWFEESPLLEKLIMVDFGISLVTWPTGI